MGASIPSHCVELVPLPITEEEDGLAAALPGTGASVIWRASGLWLVEDGQSSQLFPATRGAAAPSALWWGRREGLLVLRLPGSSHVIRLGQ